MTTYNPRKIDYLGHLARESALFGHALPVEDSFVKAFQNARERIAAREKSEHRRASEPQLYVGSEMAAKLPKLEAELRARRAGTSI